MIEQENIPYTADEIKTMVKTCEKYNNALERAENIYNSDFKPDEAAVLAKYLPKIFPELKMSEEERIKKALIKILNEIVINTNYKELGIDYNIRDMIAWLEKQGKWKPEDKIEPKFKPGDCISNGRYVKKIIDINSDWPYYMFQDGSSYRIKEIDTKWHIIPNIDELEWMNVHTDEDHCYSCELFDRKNNMCKCITLCKEPHNTYKGFYIK